MDNSIKLVKIDPIEYQYRRSEIRKSPRILRYRDLSFSPHLTRAILNRIIKNTKMKKKAMAHQNPDRYIFYEYNQKPQIILDMLERTINVSEGTLKKHGLRACQQQASILMRLLKKHRYAHFKRVSITANPSRIGRTREDRAVTFRALKNLFNDEQAMEIHPN